MNIPSPLTLLALHLVVPTAEAGETVKTWGAKLQSDRPSEWRVAQAYLAHAGIEAVPELEKLADGADGAMQRRLKETLSLMLRNTAGPESIRKRPKLWALGEPELSKAAGVLNKLAGSHTYDSGELGLMPPGTAPPPLTPPRQAFNDLLGLRGFAVPAALELVADKQPGSRMYGLEILRGLNAIGQYSAVQKSLKDDAPIAVFHGDYTSKTTVGAQTAQWLKLGALRPASAPDEPYAVAYEAENYADWLDVFAGAEENRFVLVNRLRLEAGTLRAKSWDDYWQRATPVLTAVWDRK
ncbi:hypothetical protein AYO44_14195 [Planctomycetaceae bacterium SCGC AG-212-F19]|nr:hypothetical protein AYO44_14195 [Planctomycetaceae bacterium SCGC AG-212-F19]